MMSGKNRWKWAWGILVLLAVPGCSINDEPRPRLGSYATSTPGTNFLDLSTLGDHKYYDGLFEKNGIVYTCRGGHIDIAHLRIAADYTRYLYNRTKQCLLKTDRQFSFKLNVEPSRYYIRLTYPKNWKDLPASQKEQIAQDVALELGQYLTFTMVTWHEVLTFFGYKSMAFLPEFASAFSWEDNYSNLLGIRLAAEAIRTRPQDYDMAMTALIKAQMEYLGIVSAAEAHAAAEAMRGVWFEGNILVTMKVRNMDIGLDDGQITPLLVPSMCDQPQPQSYPVPTLTSFHKHGFTMDLYIRPQEFERDQILKVVCPDGGCNRICMPDDLPIFLAYIKDKCRQIGCTVVE
ncbi:DUF4056 domain-containing protein [Anaerohalosphaeraceae bacterium U12dextr]